MTDIGGRELISWGLTPGPYFAAAIGAARQALAQTGDREAARQAALACVPAPVETVRMRSSGPDHHIFLDAETPDEEENRSRVLEHMRELMRVPTVLSGAVMPDACPAGSALGTIPVGGVVACQDAIHPGFHSADICCSVATSVLPLGVDPSAVLEAGLLSTHFGPGGRPRGAQWHNRISTETWRGMSSHPLFNRDQGRMLSAIRDHFGTQGDGNHFLLVGTRESSGQVSIVTHHGSRGPGALLYKKGMAMAESWRRKNAPEVPAHQAWIPASTEEGRMYWSALQLMRSWTRESHYAIHDEVCARLGVRPTDRHWNEHNFVFRRTDGIYYHAKGATPSYSGFGDDDAGLGLIPLNMSEPVLVVRHSERPGVLGFAPHGAGRNLSRTQYKKRLTGDISERHPGVDVRWYSGHADESELPGGYKSASAVRAQMKKYSLAEVVDQIRPHGCVMAGDWEVDASWRKKRAARLAAGDQTDATCV